MDNLRKICLKTSKIHGRGIFSTAYIKKGEKICYIEGIKASKLPRTDKEAHSIQTWFGLGRRIWINPKGTIFRFLNHSCEPSAAISGKKTLVALRNIKTDEEITIDYSMTDADPLWHMDCSCDSGHCRKIIRSIHTVPKRSFKRHMPFIPSFFQHVFFRNYISTVVKSKYGGSKK
jgi:SET domain-containing protein